MVFFNDCDIRINGTGLMAQRASIKSSNSLKRVTPLGRADAIELTPNGTVQNTFQATYYVDLDGDPCYPETVRIKNSTDFEQASSQVIEVAGISGAFYMSDFSIRVNQNNVVLANVTYKGFGELSGNVTEKTSDLNLVKSGFSGLAHSWTTFIQSDAGDLDIPVFSFDYNFANTIKPLYAIGSKLPAQVANINAEEVIKIEKDQSRQMNHYGESGCALFDACEQNPRVRIFKLGYLCDESLDKSMDFDVSGYRIVSNNVSINTNDYVKSTFEIRRID
tara:strand:- start:180 stop:1010 length:831 start_codon:yes stop_codon:yes gene_type:complete